MKINTNFIKLLFKIFIIISILECIYLFVLPLSLNKLTEKGYINKLVSSQTNAQISIIEPKFKTHILPYLTFSTKNVQLKDNENIILEASNADIKVSILPILFKKLIFQNINADYININLERDKEGIFNFQKLFKQKEKQSFKVSYKKLKTKVNNYNITVKDSNLDKQFNITGSPFVLKTKKKITYINTKGELNQDNFVSPFEVNLEYKYPVNFKKIDKNIAKGECFLYRIDLSLIKPYLQKFIDEKISEFEGFAEYIQISASNNNIILNTSFKDLKFNKTNWKNKIYAPGNNKVDANIELDSNFVKINSFNYKAENINIKADGTIKTSDKPEIDINGTVKDSKAENIASVLPPTLVPQYMTIEKVKTYGVYGDLEAKIHAKGKIPQPDITGYVKGRNVHVLDKSLHKKHKGTVDITFDKRILNMNILVEMANNQKAEINGYVYMFRDGINNVKVKTTNNVDFPLAQKIVVPVSKVFNFQLGPIPDMNITSGKGIIDINIQGSLDFINLDGFAKFDRAKLTYNGLYGEVYDGKGRLDFKGDVVSFKSEKAFVKNNPLSVYGKVKINDNLDFNIFSEKAEAKDLIEIINKSKLLKDVKDGIAVINDASGFCELFVNIKSKIVPVPFGQPPLPPEEAFYDMKVKGYLNLLDNTVYIEGFRTPIENIYGRTEFTETVVDLIDINGISGTSPLKIDGKIITDIKTKVPDVDITITSESVNLKDTIKFLTQSYLYPENYPDLSILYNIGSKHDLYFKYKAKSIDFITDNAYAVMNFIKDDETKSDLKAESGKVVLDKSTVKVENVKADYNDSSFHISGNVEKVDTLNPIYNLSLKSEGFNLENLNNTDNLEIIPDNIKNIFNQFKNYKGLADIEVSLVKNIPEGKIQFYNPQMEYVQSSLPLKFDNFQVGMKNNKISVENMTALLSDMPVYADFYVTDIYNKPYIKGYFTSKLTNNFIKNYLPENIAKKIDITGDIHVSSNIEGDVNNINITPKITFHKEADLFINGTNIGETSDEREVNGKININNKIISIKNLEYIKYISSQNNKIYPIVFTSMNGRLHLNDDKMVIPEDFEIKTYKNLSAKVLNWFLPNQLLNQGTLSFDLKYKFDENEQRAKLLGSIECRSINIPLFDTVVKHIKINADDEDINVNIFGFITDGRIVIDSKLENNIAQMPKMKSINIFAEEIDNNKLLEEFYKTRQAITTEAKQNNYTLPAELEIENGYLQIDKMTIKSMTANNFTANFSIDKNGIFYADNLNVEVGQGNIQGNFSYDLNNTKAEGNFELHNVDSDYIAETLFDGENQIYGNANGKLILYTQGLTNEEILNNLSGFVYFDISDGRMPKLGSLEYLLRASNIVKSGLTGLTLNSILEILNLVKTGYFSNINGSCIIENGIAKDIEIFSTGENLSLYINGSYDIAHTHADMEILGKLSKKISTVFGAIGNTSLNTFFKLIPGISLLDFGRKDFIENVEKIPSFTNGDYDSRTFQAIINGNINNKTGYVQSFKWVK